MVERNWLLTGGSGQVGSAMQQLALPKGVTVLVPPREMLDLANLPDMNAFIRRYKVDAIINCAAYTAVDKAESDEALAYKINAEAPGILADAAANAAIPIVHVSTDYVFSGNMTHRAYAEDDPVAPKNAYGRTKLAGEQAVVKSGARHIILRTAWVVSPFGNNFVKTMLRLGKERDALNVVCDQTGTPTNASDIAATLIKMTDILCRDPIAPQGVYHFVNAGSATWYDLAVHIFDRVGQNGASRPELTPIPTSEYPTPAQRPANSRLNTAKIARDYLITARPWQTAIDEILDQMLEIDA